MGAEGVDALSEEANVNFRVPALETKTLGVTVIGCVNCPFREHYQPDEKYTHQEGYACRLTGRVLGEYPYTTGAWETCPLKVAPAMVRLDEHESPAVDDQGTAIYGDKCKRCIDYRPGNRCAHLTCKHPEIANPPGSADLKGLDARASRT